MLETRPSTNVEESVKPIVSLSSSETNALNAESQLVLVNKDSQGMETHVSTGEIAPLMPVDFRLLPLKNLLKRFLKPRNPLLLLRPRLLL